MFLQLRCWVLRHPVDNWLLKFRRIFLPPSSR
jgi:hypothetical protein